MLRRHGPLGFLSKLITKLRNHKEFSSLLFLSQSCRNLETNNVVSCGIHYEIVTAGGDFSLDMTYNILALLLNGGVTMRRR